MLKQYLKHSHSFRKIFGPLLRVARLRFADPAMAFRRYRESVLGGTLLLAPKNIPGQFEVSATSHVASRIVLTGCYEPEVTAVLNTLKLKAGTIVNVGANVGFYAVYLASFFRTSMRVLAIEPNPEAFRLLQNNIARNGLAERIQTVQACIGESEGKLALSIIEGMPEYSSIGGIAHPAVASHIQATIEVPVLPLTSLVGEERVSFLFIDTEGAEGIVLSGARDILVRDRPILFFECSDTLLRKFGSSTRELEAQLSSLGYVVRNGLCQQLAIQHPFEGEAIAIHKADMDSQG